MSLEAAISILHAGGSGYWSPDIDPETTISLGSTLNDQGALSRDSSACSKAEGPRKGGLTKASLISQLASRGQRASSHAVQLQQRKKGTHPPVRV